MVLTGLLVGGSSMLIGCASGPPLKEETVTQSLPPMAQPERAIGYKTVQLRDGREEVNTLVAQTGDTETWTNSSGCRAVVSRTGLDPALEFANCEGSTGTHTIKLLRGTPYPLTAGGKWAYSFSGSNTSGGRWEGQRDCEVKGAARITTGTGPHDTYKVVCEDVAKDWKTIYTYYVAPKIESTVLSERRRLRYWTGAPPTDTTRWELVRQE
jgi:hypothetical protein